MSEIPAELLRSLASDDALIRRSAAQHILSLEFDVVPGLIEAAQSGDARLRVEAARILSQQAADVRALDALACMLDSDVLLVGHVAAGALKKNGTQYVHLMLEKLPHCHPTVQPLVADLLEMYGDASIVPSLLVYLKQTDFPSLQRELIDALAVLGDASVVPEIRQFADSPDRHVQKSVSRAVEKLEHKLT